MKRIALPFLVIAVAAIVAACGSKGKLASEIIGSWTSTPEKVNVAGQYEADVIVTYEFLPGGQAIISAMASVDKAMPTDEAVVAPVSLNAAATVSVSGTYEIESGSEVRIAPDMSTLQVNVDPSAVAVEYDKLSTGEQPEVATITPEYAQKLKVELSSAMRDYIPEISTISKIAIDKQSMRAEINGKASDLRKL